MFYMFKLLTGVLEKNTNNIVFSEGLRDKGTMDIEKHSSYCC
jgi:hypothetical protein